MRGELGMRVHVWSAGRQQHMQCAQEQNLADVEAKMRASECASALKMLRRVLSEAMRGELGMRVHVWRDSAQHATFLCTACWLRGPAFRGN